MQTMTMRLRITIDVAMTGTIHGIGEKQRKDQTWMVRLSISDQKIMAAVLVLLVVVVIVVRLVLPESLSIRRHHTHLPGSVYL